MSRSFDGLDDFVNCSNNSSINNVATLTFCAWIYGNTFGEGSLGRIMNKDDGSGSGKIFIFDNANVTNGLTFNHGFSTSRGAWNKSNIVSTGKWLHVAVTFDNSSDTNVPIFYVNFTDVGTLTESINSSGTANNDNTQNLIFGSNVATTRSFDGLIAYIHYFNKILSVGEINQVGKFPGSIRRGLVGFWPLPGSSSNEPDLSGNQNTGVVTGAIKGNTDPPINGIFQVPRPELVRSF